MPDRSGRVTERGLLRALGWYPGHRISIHPRAGMLIVASALAGPQVVGSRGELPLPAIARQMCAIAPGRPLVLAALVAHDLLVIHPASTIARLLAGLHVQVIGGRRDRRPATTLGRRTDLRLADAASTTRPRLRDPSSTNPSDDPLGDG